MKRKSFITTMTTCILCMCIANVALCSCSDDDGEKDDVSLTIDWNIDEEKTICLEDYIPDMGKDCEISGLDPERARVEYVSSRNVHILYPVKYVGMMKPVITTAAGRKYYITLRVYNDIAWETWELDSYMPQPSSWYDMVEKNIVCNDNIKDKVEADLKERNVLWNNLKSLTFTFISLRFWNSCNFYYNGNEDGKDYYIKNLSYQHDINTDEYTFIDKDNNEMRQTMKVKLTEKSAPIGRRKYHKKADFEFDITKEMQDKYGAENVKKASLIYHLHNFVF